jgi:hypothetical protein
VNSAVASIFRKALRSRGFSAWEAEFGGRALNFAQALACNGFLAAAEFKNPRRGGDFPQGTDVAGLLGPLLAIVALVLAFPPPAVAQSGPAVLPPPPDSGYLIVPSSGSGQPVTTVLPIPGGGYMIQQEGQPSTVVLPLPGGGASSSRSP